MLTGLHAVPQERLDLLLADYAGKIARRRRRSLAVLCIVALLVAIASHYGEVDPDNLVEHLSNLTSYFGRILPKLTSANLVGDVTDWYWNFFGWLKLLLDTVMIAYLGTFAGAAGALAAAFLAADNLTPGRWVRLSSKRILEFCRTVPDIVFAMMFVSAFGLGPLAGVLAIAIHTFGALGKQFTEVIENIDMKPVEGVRSAGGGFLDTARYGALPQVISNLASYALLRFEINVRSSSIIGFVGAGGIGQDLFVAIRKFYYTDVSAILLMIIVTVSLIDVLIERIRHRLAPVESVG